MNSGTEKITLDAIRQLAAGDTGGEYWTPSKAMKRLRETQEALRELLALYEQKAENQTELFQ